MILKKSAAPILVNKLRKLFFQKQPPEAFYKKKVFLKNSQSLQKNNCVKVTFLITTLLKKRLCNRCFPVNLVKFLRTPFLQKTSERLLLFSPKFHKPAHPPVLFNDSTMNQAVTQKHLGQLLDAKLDFQEHLKNMENKFIKRNALLRQLQIRFPRPTLITVYKSFKRPHLNYGDIIYDQAYNNSLHQKLETFPYNSALAIT